jgi:hypothetical protein
MTDQAIASPPPASKPASTPAPSSATGKTATIDPSITSKAEEMFGATAGSPYYQDEPGAEDAQTTTGTAPTTVGDAASPSSTDATQQAEAVKPIESEPLPGEDVVSEFSSLAVELPSVIKPPTDELSTLATPEGFEKSINPDGKANAETRLKNSQTLIGKWSTEVGNYRKSMGQLSQWFEFDKATGEAKPRDILAIASAMPPEVLRDQLARSGLKIVPVNEPDGAAPNGDATLDAEILNSLVPDKDLSVEEKMAIIENDAPKLTRFTIQKETALARRKLEAGEAKRAQDSEAKSYIEQLQKLPYYESELAPAMRHFHEKLPVDRPLIGKQRVEVLRQLAELQRVKPAMNRLRDAVRKHVEAEFTKKMEAGIVPSAGGPATFVNMNQRKGGDWSSPADVQKEVANAVL